MTSLSPGPYFSDCSVAFFLVLPHKQREIQSCLGLSLPHSAHSPGGPVLTEGLSPPLR